MSEHSQDSAGEPQATRDASGRFLKGVSGNPKGSLPKADLPPAITKAQARAMAAALYPDAWAQWKLAIDGGQSWAIQLAVQYELGRPTERHEHTGADGGPIQTQEVPADTRPSIDAFMAEWRKEQQAGEVRH